MNRSLQKRYDEIENESASLSHLVLHFDTVIATLMNRIYGR